ncbi:MAG: hypothetical protein AAGB03_10025 [Pseudomonadota bacterium]
MQFVVSALLAPGKSPDDLGPHAKGEAAAAWELTKSGILRNLLLREDKPGAYLMMEAKDEAEVKAALDTLPFVQHGLLTIEISPVGPYAGFELLHG